MASCFLYKRRAFITLLGGAAAWPLAAPTAAVGQQQTAKHPRIGFLYGGVSEALALRVNQFLEGVRGIERQSRAAFSFWRAVARSVSWVRRLYCLASAAHEAFD
jgi:hypothetical protein